MKWLAIGVIIDILVTRIAVIRNYIQCIPPSSSSRNGGKFCMLISIVDLVPTCNTFSFFIKMKS